MLVLITYDVEVTSEGGQRRLRRIAKACEDYGQRVQFSVFECDVDPTQWAVLKGRLFKEADLKKDSLRFYMLGSNWERKVEHHGTKPAIDFNAPLIL